MKYFKHYSNARRSESLSILIADHGLEAYARYWILLEFLAEEFDGESTSFRYHSSTIRELLRIQSWTKLRLVADQLSTVRGIALRQNETVFEIEAPILLDLLNRDFKKARTERAPSAVYIKNKIKDKEEDKEEELRKASQPRKAQSTDSDFAKNKGKLFVATYCELFKQKYGVNPEIIGKDAGIAKRLSKDLSEEKIKLIIGAYFALPDAWLVKVKHPMSVIETKLNEITVFIDSGNFTTLADLKQIEKNTTMQKTWEDIQRGVFK